MKLIPLSQGLFTKVDDDIFDYLNQWKWYAHRYGNNYYVSRGERTFKKLTYRDSNQKVISIKMHRVIMNTPSDMQVDHINGDGLDNQKSNLRICTLQQNSMNKKSHVDSKSRYLGVCHVTIKNKNKITSKAYNYWLSTITVNYKRYNLGYFKTKEEAACAYDEAAKKYHGEFAHLNFVPIITNQ